MSMKNTIVFSFLGLFWFLPQWVLAQSGPSQTQVAAYSGLLQAAHEDDLTSVLALIADGSNLESRDTSGRTPVIVAAYASNDRIIEALARAGADMNALEHQDYDIVTIASVANDLTLLKLALDNGASAKNRTSPYDGTALIAAAHLGHQEVVAMLIEHGAPLDHVNNLGWTALIEAVILGDGGKKHTRTVKRLLKAGADQTLGDSQGVTPLTHAKSNGYQEMVNLFISYQK